MSQGPLSSRLGWWLLRVLERRLPADQREFVIGDLLEGERRERQRSGQLMARFWLLRQTFGLFRHGLLELNPNSGRQLMKIPRGRREIVHDLVRDLCFGVRRLRRSPGPSLVVVATLAVGIGLGALVFMLADAVLFRPLPFAEPDRLLSVETNTGGSGWYGSSEPELLDLQALPVFESVGAWRGGSRTLDDGDPARQINVALVSSALLPSLGAAPLLGRLPAEDDYQPGAESVVLLSHGFWQGELGGRAEIIGQTLRLSGSPVTVLGVMPAGFRYPGPWAHAWQPLQLDRQDPWSRNNHYLQVVAKMAPGLSLAEARAAVDTLVARSALDYPEFYGEAGYRTRILGLRQTMTTSERLPMLALLGAVGLLLLLTCTNVANVQLGRGASSARDLAVRSSLGASRGRLVVELMVESLVLAGAGALLAVALAKGGEALLPRVLPESILRFGEPRLDLRVLGVTLAVALSTVFAFGLWPALRSTRSAQQAASGATSNRQSGRSRWLRSALVAGQMTLAVILLVGCGMLIRSLQRLVELDPGFTAEGVLTVRSLLPPESFDSPEKTVDYYLRAQQLLSELPGVEAAGAMARPPLTGRGDVWSIELEGQPVAKVSEAPAASVQHLTPGTFAALGIELREGRVFGSGDSAEGEPVAVVNEAFAGQYWSGGGALGKRFRVYSEGSPWMRVVGVVATVRDRQLDSEGVGQWYVPHAQGHRSAYLSPPNMTWVVKTSPDHSMAAATILARLREHDPRAVLVEPAGLSSSVARALALPRQMVIWFGIFAAVALGLAALGLYGVLSYMVVVRRAEIGIRMALGAAPHKILGNIVAEGLLCCAAGLILGLGVGLTLARAGRSFIFGLELADPVVILAALAVLTFVGCLAPLAPAWRASRIDPCAALREE